MKKQRYIFNEEYGIFLERKSAFLSQLYSKRYFIFFKKYWFEFGDNKYKNTHRTLKEKEVKKMWSILADEIKGDE